MRRLSEWGEDNFKRGTKNFTKHMRLFLVCAQTYRLVPCGPNGQGYDIHEVRERWQTIGSLVLTVLQVSSETVGAAVAAGNLPPSLA